jgi:DNA-binding NarL/FixJ family response regulator
VTSARAGSRRRATTLVVADDHPVVRDGLVGILQTQGDFSVVGTAASSTEAVKVCASARPDVAIIDLELPPADGVTAIEHIRRDTPGTRCLVFTAFATDERVLAAVRAGARGYVLKGAPSERLFEAIRTVAAGGLDLPPDVSDRVAAGPADARALTERQTQVLRELAAGHTNREIAQRLGIAERTVKFHLSELFARLEVTNRTAAVAEAIERGVIRRV